MISFKNPANKKVSPCALIIGAKTLALISFPVSCAFLPHKKHKYKLLLTITPRIINNTYYYYYMNDMIIVTCEPFLQKESSLCHRQALKL